MKRSTVRTSIHIGEDAEFTHHHGISHASVEVVGEDWAIYAWSPEKLRDLAEACDAAATALELDLLEREVPA